MPKILEAPLEAVAAFRRNRWRAQSSQAAFARRGLIPRSPDSSFLAEIDRYWKTHLGRKVNPLWHLACATVTGIKDVRFVPHDVWLENVLPTFNRLEMRPAYLDKNLVDVLIGGAPGPRTTVKRMHGRYYDADDRSLTRELAEKALVSENGGLIIKGSRTDDGANIRAIHIEGAKMYIDEREVGIEELERSHGSDFIVQERIRQSPTMAEPHPSSVNTVRIATLRWGNDIRVLVSFARFGIDGKLTDNAGTGGICCAVDANGILNATGVDEYGGVHTKHPTSGYDFSQRANPELRADVPIGAGAARTHLPLRHCVMGLRHPGERQPGISGDELSGGELYISIRLGQADVRRPHRRSACLRASADALLNDLVATQVTEHRIGFLRTSPARARTERRSAEPGRRRLPGMRGADSDSDNLFTTVRLEEFVPANHPLRPIRTWAPVPRSDAATGISFAR